MRLEIKQTLEAIPIMALFTVPFFVAEVRGLSFIYDSATNIGYFQNYISDAGTKYGKPTWVTEVCVVMVQ